MRLRWLSPANARSERDGGAGSRRLPRAILASRSIGRRGGSLASDTVFPHPVGVSRPRPNGFTNAATRRFTIEERSPLGGSEAAPRFAPTPSLDTKPPSVTREACAAWWPRVPSLIFVWTEKRGAVHRSSFRNRDCSRARRPSPMRRAHRLGTRRCSYRFCHRDRCASTRPMLLQPRWTRGARPGWTARESRYGARVAPTM